MSQPSPNLAVHEKDINGHKILALVFTCKAVHDKEMLEMQAALNEFVDKLKRTSSSNKFSLYLDVSNVSELTKDMMLKHLQWMKGLEDITSGRIHNTAIICNSVSIILLKVGLKVSPPRTTTVGFDATAGGKQKAYEWLSQNIDNYKRDPEARC